MTVPTLPTLPGMGYPITRTPIWNRTITEFTSGKRTEFTPWTSPRYQYRAPYEFLRNNSAEMQALLGFFNEVINAGGLFQFTDPDDNTIINQVIGVGDGTKNTYQLLRSFGGFVEPVYAWTAAVIFQNGTVTPPAGGISPYGVVNFGGNVVPGNVVSWSGSYNWYCRFDDKGTLDFEKWLSTMYRMKEIVFTTEKFVQ